MAPKPTVPLFVILLGAALLASPVAVFEADIGEPTWEYGATEITLEDGEVQFPDPTAIPRPVYVDDIACTDETRSCALERHVHDEGGLPVGNASFERTAYEYVIIDGEILEASHETQDGTTILTHSAVDQATALRRSSGAYDRVHPAYRAAIEEGSVTADTWIETPRVITRNPESPTEQFFYVYQIREPSPGNYAPTTGQRAATWTLSALGFLFGLGLVLHGQRMRVRREGWYGQIPGRGEDR